MLITTLTVLYLMFGFFMVVANRMLPDLLPDDADFNRESLVSELALLILGPTIFTVMAVFALLKVLYNKLRGGK